MPQTRTRTQQNLIALTFASVLATTVSAWGLNWSRDAARETGGSAREQTQQLDDTDSPAHR